MNELEFLFSTDEDGNWLEQLQPETPLSASQLLIHCEGTDEEQLEEIFLQLESKNIIPDVSELPAPFVSGEIAARLKQEQQIVKQGLTPEKLEKTDPLRLYLEEVANIPACGDISSLARQLSQANAAKDPAEALRGKVVDLSLGRVVALAAEYTGRGVLLLDLIQEGSIGLWRAIEMFCGEGAEFRDFRDGLIRFYIVKAVIFHAYESGVGEKLRRAVEDYRSVDERLLGDLGRNPTPEEMAAALHMSVEETMAVAKTLETVRLLNRTLQPEPEELPQEEEQAVEDTAYFQMRQRITELLSVLPQEDAKLLSLRYGLEGGVPMTAQQTASRLGITADQVMERETAALSKLRQQS